MRDREIVRERDKEINKREREYLAHHRYTRILSK
jgi:hypothetical protein